MRKLIVLASFLAAGCGGGSSGGGGPTPLSGTIGGRALTVTDVKALTASSEATPCSITLGGTTVNAGIKAIALEVASYANACDPYSSSGRCAVHASAQSVTVLFARIVPPSLTQPNPDVTGVPLATVGTTYDIHANVAQALPDGSTGYLYATYAIDLATGAAPTCAATPPAVQSGTITFTSVTGTITGHLSVTFVGGDTVSGDFSAPLCTGTALDVCSLASGTGPNPLCTGTTTCVP